MKLKQQVLLVPLNLTTKALCSSETRGNANAEKRCHSPENLISQQVFHFNYRLNV